MLVVAGTLVRRSDMASLIGRRGDLTPETENFEEEQSDPVRTFAQLRRLGVGLVTVSHANLVGLIRISRPSTHPSNATGERFLTHSFGSLQSAPERRVGCHPLHDWDSKSSPVRGTAVTETHCQSSHGYIS